MRSIRKLALLVVALSALAAAALPALAQAHEWYVNGERLTEPRVLEFESELEFGVESIGLQLNTCKGTAAVKLSNHAGQASASFALHATPNCVLSIQGNQCSTAPFGVAQWGQSGSVTISEGNEFELDSADFEIQMPAGPACFEPAHIDSGATIFSHGSLQGAVWSRDWPKQDCFYMLAEPENSFQLEVESEKLEHNEELPGPTQVYWSMCNESVNLVS
jgi:hypothetical protein